MIIKLIHGKKDKLQQQECVITKFQIIFIYFCT